MRTHLIIVLLLVPYLSKAQYFKYSIFNEQDALKYGIPYFKGKEPITGGEVMIDYKLPDDFRGSVDLTIAYKNLGGCKTPCSGKPAYVYEMTATVTNNTNTTMIAGEIRAGFPRLPLGSSESDLYLSQTCEPSLATCSLSSGAFHHIASDSYLIPFDQTQTLTDCGIYPANEYLILRPGASRTIKKREWLTQPAISFKPFFERGRIIFCLTTDELANTASNTSGGDAIDMIFKYHDPGWQQGDAYGFMNYSCPGARQYYITKVFKYDPAYLKEDLLKSYYGYLKPKLAITESFMSLTGSGNGSCQIYLETGTRPLSKDEAEEIRKGVVDPLIREKINIHEVLLKIN